MNFTLLTIVIMLYSESIVYIAITYSASSSICYIYISSINRYYTFIVTCISSNTFWSIQFISVLCDSVNMSFSFPFFCYYFYCKMIYDTFSEFQRKKKPRKLITTWNINKQDETMTPTLIAISEASTSKCTCYKWWLT